MKKDGTWISVKPLPNAFIVSIGDVLEVSDSYFIQCMFGLICGIKLIEYLNILLLLKNTILAQKWILTFFFY